MHKFQRKISVVLLLMAAVASMGASRQDSLPAPAVYAIPKYNIVVSQVTDVEEVIRRNDNLGEEATKGLFGDMLGAALKMSYGTFVSQKVTNLTENVMKYTTQFIVSSIQERKNRFKNWYVAAGNRCHFSKTISQKQVYDFYALPSNKGAFDYENIKFKGFGFRSSLTLPDHSDTVSCYIYCSFREDQEAINNIVNHGKFLVQLDTVLINTRWFDLPNDSIAKDTDEDFFLRHKDLTVTLNAKFFSSWFNEAIMLQDEQELGEFVATIPVDASFCRDGIFSYVRGRDSIEPGNVAGECFIVPRSYCGIALLAGEEQPTWGTGQYRIEMTLREDCQLNQAYYLDSIVPIDPIVPIGPIISMANIPEPKLFDKAKWMTEWTQMQAIHKDKNKSPWRNYWTGLWREVVSVVQGAHWITTYTEPFMKAYLNTQSEFINKGLDLAPKTNSTPATGKP